MSTEMSIEQQTNRIAKGYDIFSQNLIEQISEYEYLIKDRYVVTMFSKDDILSTCTCMDWKHRINMIDTDNTFRCKHQISVEMYLMNI
jgi:hypothetical protein